MKENTIIHWNDIQLRQVKWPSLVPQPNLFVKNLPGETKSIDIFQLFSPFGKIFSCNVKYSPNGKCKGYGYVQFEDKEAADKALEALNNQTFKEAKIDRKSVV